MENKKAFTLLKRLYFIKFIFYFFKIPITVPNITLAPTAKSS